MTDTPHKQAVLSRSVEPSSSLELSYPSELLRPPAARQARGQDTIYGGRRVLVSRHGGGSDRFLTDNAGTGGVNQSKPEPDVWRVVYRARTELAAGQMLVARALVAPAGATEEFSLAAGGTWQNHGVGGDTRVVLSWDNVDADTATETVQFPTPPAFAEGGGEEAEPGWTWAHLEHLVAAGIRPPGAANSLSEQAKWSEWPTVTASVQDRGGARVVHFSLAEEPDTHVAADTATDVSANGVSQSLAWQNKIPQTEQADGTTFEEHRFGIHRALYVGTRQTARLGPRICHWSAYAEGIAAVDDAETAAQQINSPTFVRVSAGPNTAWDADAVGFDLISPRRAPENLETRISGAAVDPVRLRVYARFTAAGANVAIFRLQTSPRSWIELEIDQAVVGTAFTWLAVTGFVESNLHSDDTFAIAQDFALTPGGILEIRYWDLSYGDYAVGA